MVTIGQSAFVLFLSVLVGFAGSNSNPSLGLILGATLLFFGVSLALLLVLILLHNTPRGE